ncbi:MAG: hypothetical protein M1819_006781 [Sarea resinae]|nr:MAG: hypothetical protein M1819_006781 [Sarea resinae]
MSGEFRPLNTGSSVLGNGNGPMPVPSGAQNAMSNGHLRSVSGLGGPGGFDGPKSPPGTKNTSHVPCKFFRQGACQAGKACPFLHSNDSATETAPCKYFAKGNCKFGAKCALAHILPDGRRVNRPNLAMGGGHLNLGGRVNPQLYHNHESALAGSLLSQQANGRAASGFGPQYPYPVTDEFTPLQGQPNPKVDIPTIDTSFTASHPASKYGSPRDDGRLPLSPVGKGLSALDAPLPASFDSQGISWMARHGPVAASVPSKFGLESPPSSLPNKSTIPASDALRTLHDSAFGDDTRNRFNSIASSPPVGNDEYFNQRPMHSQRYTKPNMVSASLPRAAVNDDWDDNFAFEEDLVPNSLHELLTPQEKMRRFSRTEDDTFGQRQSFSGIGTPGDSSSKVGSPTTSSPSRFGPLFARQQKKEEEPTYPVSGFGHVGSPLRNSSLHPGASPNLRAVSRPTSGDVSPYVSSPPRQSSMSMISQQLQRTRLSRAESSEGVSTLHASPGPGSARHSSVNQTGRLDRAISSSSIGASRIDEEQGDFVFSMEEEDEGTKRYSGGFSNYSGAGGATISRQKNGTPTSAKEGRAFLEMYSNERD